MVIFKVYFFCNSKEMFLKFEQRKFAVLTALAASVVGAMLPMGSAWAAAWVQHGDDSVRRNGEVSQPEVPARARPDPIVVIPPLAHYLMQRAVLTSSVGLNEVRFSGYKNNSPYPLVISLEYAGAPQDKHSSVGIVGGVGVNWSIYASTFEVPPGSSYGFNVQSTYVISAWMVMGIDEKTDKTEWEALQRQTGLPTKEVFARPMRLAQTYKGCLETQTNGKFTGNYYFYTPGQWTDGADPMRDVEIVDEFVNIGWLVRGSAPLNPGVCRVRNDVVDTSSGGSGI
jgi:hypothetical protein